MMPSISDLDALWQRIDMPNESGATAVGTTGVNADGEAVIIGRDHLGRRHLLVPLAGNGLRLNLRAAGLQANAPRQLMEADRSVRYLDIYCTRPELHDIFTRLAADLVAEAAKPQLGAARRCADLLEEWRGLFGFGTGAFGKTQAVGLLGELWLLRRLIRLRSDAITTWTGPLGGIHDFRSGTAAIEVKTTVRSRGRFHAIASIEQLLPPPQGRLGFLSIRLEQVPNGSLSIAALLTEIRAAGISGPELTRRLEEVGFKEGQQPELEHERYEVRDDRLYEVGPDFPSITSESFAQNRVPPGVLSVCYEIDLTGEPPRPFDAETAERWFAAFL